MMQLSRACSSTARTWAAATAASSPATTATAPRRDATWNVDGANITDQLRPRRGPGYLNMAARRDHDQLRQQRRPLPDRRRPAQTSSPSAAATPTPAWPTRRFKEGPGSPRTSRPTCASPGRATPGARDQQRSNLYGANFGGPVVKEQGSFYGSTSIQDLGRTHHRHRGQLWLDGPTSGLDGQLTRRTPGQPLPYEYDTS